MYCKHCGKSIDADSAFCMHCGGVINPNSNSTHQANMQDISFIRQLDILGGKFLIGIINIIKWCGRTLLNIGKFLKPYWKRILIFIIGIAGAILLIGLGVDWEDEYRIMFILPAIPLIILTLYFSCSKSIKLLLPSSILLFCSYGALIYYDHECIYGRNTTFLDTIKREFCLVTPNYIIPDHATSIGERAFVRCSSLKRVTIPESVTSIGGSAFYGCTSLTSVTIPDSVTSIGERAFACCSSLTSVTIPDSVTSIGEEAFSSCCSLTSVYCKPTIPPTGGYEMFYKNASGRKIYVPRNSVSAYKSAQYWYYIVGYDF